MPKLLLLLFLLLAGASAPAQRWHIRHFTLAYRNWESESVGNHPLTVPFVLRNPKPLNDFIASFPPTGLTGGGHNLQRSITAQVSLFGRADRNPFWRRWTLNGGAHITLPATYRNGSIEQQTFTRTPDDTSLTVVTYSLQRVEQYGGLNAGLIRRSDPARRFRYSFGLELKGSLSLRHHYLPRLDSFSTSTRNGTVQSGRLLPRLEGKRIHQWQAFVPLAVEFAPLPGRLYLRAEAALGVLRGPYRTTRARFEEMHALGGGLVLELAGGR